MADRALSRGRSVRPQTAEQYHATLIWALRRDQNRGYECEPVARDMTARYPSVPSWQGILGAIYLDAGELALAREVYEPLAGNRFTGIRPDRNWLTGLALLAEICAAIEDRPGARLLLERLEPAERLAIVPGRGGIAFLGSVARPLALLAHTLGDDERALSYLGVAEHIETRMGAVGALRRTHAAGQRMGLISAP
jgi:hypothetical protein